MIKNSLGEIVTQDNIDSYLEKLDSRSAGELLQNILEANNEARTDDHAWQRFNAELGEQDSYIRELVQNTQDVTRLTGDDLVEANERAREAVLRHNDALEQQSLGARAANIALKGLSTIGNMGLSLLGDLALEFAVDTISDMINRQDQLAESAQKIGEEFRSTKSDLEGYKQQIEELANVVNDPSSSIEEVTTARQNLLTVQDEMIAKFGEEANAADLVTQALNGQTDAFNASINAIGRREFDKSKKKYMDDNDEWWAGYDESWNDLLDNMNNAEIDFSEIYTAEGYSTLEDRDKNLLKYKEWFEKYNIELDEATSTFVGNAYDLEKALENLIPTLDEDKASNVQAVLDELRLTIAANGELYNEDIFYNKITPNKELNKYLNDLTSAKEAYDKAFVSGKTSEIDAATQSYANLYNQIKDISAGDAGLAKFFENLFPSMNSVMKDWDFTQKFENNVDGLKDTLTEWGNYTNKLMRDGMTLEEVIRNFEYGGEDSAYLKFANKYSMTIDEIIDKMQDLGLVYSEQYNELIDHFGYENISKLTDEDLEFAYKIENIGNLTFDELMSKIETARRIAENEIDIRTTVNWDEYQKAKETPNAGDKYDSVRESLKQAKEAYDAGLTGTDDFKTFAKFISPNGMTDPANFAENYPIVSKYFTEGHKGSLQLLKDMEKLGHAAQQADGSWNLDLQNIPNIANELGLSLELFMVSLGKLEDFGFTKDYFGTMDEGAAKLTERYTELGKAEEKLAEVKKAYKEGRATKTAVEAAEQEVEAIEAGISTLEKGMNDLASTDKLQEQFDGASSAMDSMMADYNDWLKKADKDAPGFDFIKEAKEKAMKQLSDEFGIEIKFDDNGFVQLDTALADAEAKIKDCQDVLDGFRDKDGTLNLDNRYVQEALNDLRQAVSEKQKLNEPSIMKIDTSQLNASTAEVVGKYQELQRMMNELEFQKLAGLDTSEAEAKIANLKKELNTEESMEIAAKLGFEGETPEEILASMQTQEPITIPAELKVDEEQKNIIINAKVDGQEDIDDLQKKLDLLPEGGLPVIVNCDVNGEENLQPTIDMLKNFTEIKSTIKVDGVPALLVTQGVAIALKEVDDSNPEPVIDAKDYASSKIGNVSDKLTNLDGKSATTYVTTIYQETHKSSGPKSKGPNKAGTVLNGTAHTNGTTILSSALTNAWRGYMNTKPNAAFAGGNWGLPYDQTALVGEVGPELLV